MNIVRLQQQMENLTTLVGQLAIALDRQEGRPSLMSPLEDLANIITGNQDNGDQGGDVEGSEDNEKNLEARPSMSRDQWEAGKELLREDPKKEL